MEQAVPPQNRRCTLAEYIRLDDESDERFEFRDGEVVGMSGGTLEHARITANVIVALHTRVKPPCSTFSSDLRLQVARQKLYSYGDATVICGTPTVSDVEGVGPTYTNPRLVVEVLSPSTRKFVQTKKFNELQKLESFQEYLLIEQDEPRVETRYRHADGHWGIDFAVGMESTIQLRSLGIALPLTEIFAGVVFPPSSNRDDFKP